MESAAKSGFETFDIAIPIFGVVMAALFYIIFRKFNILSEIRKFLNREDRLIDANYTLFFESDVVVNVLPAKKISVVTKVVLVGLCLAFIAMPFGNFLPTFEFFNCSRC